MNTQAQKQYNILLIGDACQDTYVYGNVNRISPEAPVPVFEPRRVDVKEGMAGNVAKNLEALGCTVNFLHGSVSNKQRLIDERSKQQLIRIDQDAISEPIVFETALPGAYDAIVISDYNKGTVSVELVQELRNEFKGPIFVDTKKQDLSKFCGCFVKINALEYSRATSLPAPTDLIVTQGEQGVLYCNETIPAMPVGITDVTGAGDTFLSALTYQYLKTSNIKQAIEFANRAASVTVQHVGVYAPTIEEIQ
jgi:bifunctional ADP-heptose synthase (sugar kinase/adenylyltransferase)